MIREIGKLVADRLHRLTSSQTLSPGDSGAAVRNYQFPDAKRSMPAHPSLMLSKGNVNCYSVTLDATPKIVLAMNPNRIGFMIGNAGAPTSLVLSLEDFTQSPGWNLTITDQLPFVADFHTWGPFLPWTWKATLAGAPTDVVVWESLYSG